MKKLLISCGLLVALASFGQVPVPATTTFTRDFLRATDAASARSKLGVGAGSTNGTPEYVNGALLGGPINIRTNGGIIPSQVGNTNVDLQLNTSGLFAKTNLNNLGFNFVNVKHYGAVSGGVDDTAAFVAAYDAIKANGGTIYIPYSTAGYLVNIVITNDNITLLGEGADSGGSTNNVLRPFDTTKPVIQVGNDTRNVLGFQMSKLAIIAMRGTTNCPGAIHFLGGAFNSKISQVTALGGSDTIKLQGGTTFPSTLNKFSQCAFWEGTNSTIKSVYPAAGSFTTGNTFSDCYVNGHNSSGFAVIVDAGTPANFANTYFDMADNHGFYLTNGPSVHFQNCPVEVSGGLGLFTVDSRPGTNTDYDLTRYVEGDGNDFQGTVIFWDALATNSFTIPGVYGWHSSSRYGLHFRPTLLTGMDLAAVYAPYTNLYSIIVENTNETNPLIFKRADGRDPRLEFQGSTNVYIQVRSATNQNQILAVDFYPLAGGDTNTAGVEFFRNTSRTNSLYVDIHQGTNGFSVQSRLSANSNSWLNSLVGNVGIGTQTPTAKLSVEGAVTVLSNLTVNSATAAEGSVFSISSGVGQFVSQIANASISDVAFSKITAGATTATLTNNGAWINQKPPQDIVSWSGNNVSQNIDMAGAPVQWMIPTNNTTWSFVNVPTSTNRTAKVELHIYNPSTYTGTFSYTGLVWVSKITPTITTNGWTKFLFDWNGTNVLGTLVDGGSTNALTADYGGTGTSNGDINANNLVVTNSAWFQNTSLAYAGGTNITIDLANSTKSVYYLTLTNTAFFTTPSNVPASATTNRTLYVFLKQDATGGWSVTWTNSTFKFPGGTVPTITTNANAVDLVTLTLSPFTAGQVYAVTTQDIK